MSLPVLLAWGVILIAFPLNLAATLMLFRLTRRYPDSVVLRERGYVSGALLLVVATFAVIFINNGMDIPVLNSEATQLITRTAVLALALPALYWLYLYRSR